MAIQKFIFPFQGTGPGLVQPFDAPNSGLSSALRSSFFAAGRFFVWIGVVHGRITFIHFISNVIILVKVIWLGSGTKTSLVQQI